MNKRILALILCLALLVSAFPTAFAAGTEPDAAVKAAAPFEGVNLALNKPVEAQSEESSKGNYAPLMLDGDPATRWAASSSDMPQWVVVDLGQACEITGFSCNFYNGATTRSYQYEIYTSMDGETYQLCIDRKNNTTQNQVDDAAPVDTIARWVKLVVTGSSTGSANASLWEFGVYGSEPKEMPGPKDNLALNKPVTFSGTENGLEKFDGKYAVDGVVSAESRWSPAKDTSKQAYEAYLQVDLGNIYYVQEIDVRFESEPHAYEILVSVDGQNWTQVANVVRDTEGVNTVDKTFYLDRPTPVRYVKHHQTEQWKHASNGNYYGGSIYELEVYQETLIAHGAANVLKDIAETAPTLSADGKTLILPQLSNEDYTVELYGSDNKQVVTLDGKVNQPLVDMPVNVLYRVTSKTDPTDTAVSEADVKFIVPGANKAEAGDNEKPNVVPGLREWKGGSGEFQLTDSSAIVVADASLTETAEQIQLYFKNMLNRDVDVKTGAPAKGDVYLKLNSDLAYLGGEGYTLDADDVFTVEASTVTGVLYGGVSLTQVLYQDAEQDSFPKGQAHDYPKYPVRSGMLDVGRMYIPLEYVQEMGYYMAWFKMNTLHMHINDYWKSGYYGFRLESETYPIIQAKDGYYTKEAYKQFQKDLEKCGLSVVTEIDSPYHAECFREIPGIKMKDVGQMEIRDDESYAAAIGLIKDLMDEYLDGEDPVFRGGRFHIGTDEYDRSTTVAREAMRKYTNELIEYTNEKGITPYVWGSIGSNGFAGSTPVSNDAVMNLWATYWYPTKEVYADGYDVVNTDGGNLYIVPGGNANYYKDMDIADRYDNFDVNKFTSWRNGDGTIMPLAHPQTIGAQFCIWNDMTSYRGGFSEFDVFYLFKNAVATISEKTWFGEKQEGQTAAQYLERFDAVDDMAGSANPGRFVPSKTDVVVDMDFTANTKDNSGNGYDASLTGGAKVENGVLKLDGTGALELPVDSVGIPYTVKVDVKLDENTPANTLLFSGKDGQFYANVDGTGHPGFKRGYSEGTQYVGYTFVFNDTTLPTGQWFSLVLTCGPERTALYINGVEQTRAYMTEDSKNNGFQSHSSRDDSNTFILPVEKLGENLKGELDGLMIFNRKLSAAEIEDLVPVDPTVPQNLALEKPATASSSYPDKPWTADKAVDGIVGPDNRWGSKRSTGQGSNDDGGQHGTKEQWLQVDLLDVYPIEKIVMNWENAFATHYKLMGSLDGQTWFELKDVTATSEGQYTFDNLGSKLARYIKVDCLTAKNEQWGYSIYEMEVYSGPSHLITVAEAENGSVTASMEYAPKNMEVALTMTPDEGYELDTLTVTGANGAVDVVDGKFIMPDCDVTVTATFKSTAKPVDKTALADLIAQAEALNEADYTEDSWKMLKAALSLAKLAMANDNADQAAVDKAVEALSAAIAGLAEKPTPADKTALAALVAEAEALAEDDYTAESWKALETALNTAKAVLNSENATQAMVDAVFQVLSDAMDGLEKKPEADKSDLEDLVEDMQDVENKDYTKDSWKDFQDALEQAEDVLADEDATQAEIDKALNELKDAYEALEKKKEESGWNGIVLLPGGKDFDDVDEYDWFYDAVDYVTAEGLMNGVSDDRFAPNAVLTRGMVAQILYNLEGVANTYPERFPDVTRDDWYCNAAAWASYEGIMKGYGDGRFGGNDPVTREQLAATLYRYAAYRGWLNNLSSSLTRFEDGHQTSDWAVKAMEWAVGNELMAGSNGKLDPTGTATRAQVAQVLMNFCERIA